MKHNPRRARFGWRQPRGIWHTQSLAYRRLKRRFTTEEHR